MSNTEFGSTASSQSQQPSEAIQPAMRKAKSVAEAQLRTGAERIKGVAQAVEDAAGNLEQEWPQAAKVVRDAASSVEQSAENLKGRSADELLGNITDFARSQPVAFFAGAVLGGFVLARFLKSGR